MNNLSEVEKEAVKVAWPKGWNPVGKVGCTILIHYGKLDPENIDDVIEKSVKIGVLIGRSASVDTFIKNFESVLL